MLSNLEEVYQYINNFAEYAAMSEDERIHLIEFAETKIDEGEDWKKLICQEAERIIAEMNKDIIK